MAVGFAWEVAAEYMASGMGLDEAIDLAFKRTMVALNKTTMKQVRLEKDGIHMTPDGLDPIKGELISYKATWRSLGKAMTKEDFETNFWTWKMQEASYCLAAGVDTVTWVVLWVCGDYKGAKGPKVMQATAVFTPDELADNWRVVLKHAGHTPTP